MTAEQVIVKLPPCPPCLTPKAAKVLLAIVLAQADLDGAEGRLIDLTEAGERRR